MKKEVIFFHGGGSKEDFDADQKLVNSLRSKLGSAYVIHYPFMPNDGTPDLGRRKQIEEQISQSKDNVILVAHSFGASMLLAFLSENIVTKRIAGIFLLSTPFWTGNEDWVKPFKLKPDFSSKLDKNIPLFFYRCRDDKEVPFAQFAVYKRELTWATFREISNGGHQMNNDLTIVAEDVSKLTL